MGFIGNIVEEIKYELWLRPLKEIKHLRAHHVLSLYNDYLEDGSIPQTRMVGFFGSEVPIKFPLLISGTEDDICRKCVLGAYPYEKYACNLDLAERLDKEATSLLGLKLGKKYTEWELEDLFRRKLESEERNS